MCLKLLTTLWQVFLHRGQRVLVTLLQRCYRVSVIIDNNLTNSPEGIGNFGKPEILAIELPIPSDPLPECCDYPLEHLADVIV
jgi:hypothetical protein